MKDWLIVTGDFTRQGGMDRANYALADYLARQGRGVHLVAHRAAEDLQERSGVRFRRVSRPLGSNLLGAAGLDRAGRKQAQAVTARAGRVLVNGGNCRWFDLNWVHYVHAAYTPQAEGSLFRRMKGARAHLKALAAERAVVPKARLVFCNSRKTQRDVMERLKVAEERTRVVYYGTEPETFFPAEASEREAARKDLGWDAGQPVAVFVGALGDRRKGFDVLLEAWNSLCKERNWDVQLAVAGAGAESAGWGRRLRDAGLHGRVTLLGFRTDIPRILAAADVLVHPARYEAYGLGVHEALCRGVPVIVSAHAGVAEKMAGADEMLLPDAESVVELAARLKAWRATPEKWTAAARKQSLHLRVRTWDHMAEEMVSLAEEIN